MSIKIRHMISVLIIGTFFGFSNLSFAASNSDKADLLKIKGTINSINAAPPVKGKVANLEITVLDENGLKTVFLVNASTHVVNKLDNKPSSATIAPGRNVVVKYEVKDGVNKARVIKLVD
ncbi:MAG: hypothetical protein HQL17_06820 [Candidatus Omnitrophica bacterium]|nr:hypothetical protein [Candidatus Omnitrophota bacterium]